MNGIVSKRKTKWHPGVTIRRRRLMRIEKDREMVIDFWRRSFKGERVPLAGVIKKFGLGSQAGINFYVRNHISAMSNTKH